jgi:hypothetical protein
MPPDASTRTLPSWEAKPQREENGVRAEQTVSEMVVESLARQAEALSEESGQSF